MAAEWVVIKLQGADDEFYEVGRMHMTERETWQDRMIIDGQPGYAFRYPSGMSDRQGTGLMRVEFQDNDGNVVDSVEILDPVQIRPPNRDDESPAE